MNQEGSNLLQEENFDDNENIYIERYVHVIMIIQSRAFVLQENASLYQEKLSYVIKKYSIFRTSFWSLTLITKWWLTL